MERPVPGEETDRAVFVAQPARDFEAQVSGHQLAGVEGGQK
ncbi:hypothetical protein HDC93_005642 [Streptomyces sp. AK010]|nr:hypothetical protein [Streptomyces sp. AK010]